MHLPRAKNDGDDPLKKPGTAAQEREYARWIDKAATWRLADTLGGKALVDLIVEQTHTCYLGDRSVRHAWGYGCGRWLS